MSFRRLLPLLLIALLVIAAPMNAIAQDGGPAQPAATLAQPGTGFTYQGQLTSSGTPVTAACDFQFSLFDAFNGGAKLGNTQPFTGATVSGGRFTVVLNGGGEFGPRAFDGSARWLEIAVRCPTTVGGFTTLIPRQALTPAPLALALPGLRTEQNVTSPNVIGGHISNTVSGGAYGATIGGGGESGFPNTVGGNYGTIGGGWGNTIPVTGTYAFVGGGFLNSASSDFATVAGGQGNVASGSWSVVAGGQGNTASGLIATVAGGTGNTADGLQPTVGGGNSNTASGDFATVAGGGSNIASGAGATIGGGFLNSAGDAYATVAGGGTNIAGGDHTAIGGGANNVISATLGTIAGGGYLAGPAYGNRVTDEGGFVGGGGNNQAGDNAGTETDAYYAAVAGGWSNTASGKYAAVPGGDSNTASGSYSFAAGRNARAIHNGAYVWADGTGAVISSTTTNQFLVRASGGITLYTDAGATVGAALYLGSSSWSVVSDRDAKRNFAPVDGVEILNTLAGIPIETWNYNTQAASIRHMGPMAQDWYAAFSLGENDTTISAVDADGVALAAIQGLYAVVREKEAEIAVLNERVAALESASAPATSTSNTFQLALVLVAGLLAGAVIGAGAFALGMKARPPLSR